MPAPHSNLATQLPEGPLAVAVSGGVDSLAALLLSLESGRKVLAIHARMWRRDESSEARACEQRLAQTVADLGCDFHLADLEKSYKQLQTAGALSGLSYANAGCAAVHALSYPLSIRLKIPHGEANYLVFNEVLKIYAAKNPTGALDDIEEIIASTLNCTKENALIKSDNLCGTLMQRKPLSSYGMKENQILEFTDMVLTRQHMLIANGYVQLTVGEIAQIYKDLL